MSPPHNTGLSDKDMDIHSLNDRKMTNKVCNGGSRDTKSAAIVHIPLASVKKPRKPRFPALRKLIRFISRTFLGKTANLGKYSEEEQRLSAKLRNMSLMTNEEALGALNTTEGGHSDLRAAHLLNEYGKNELPSGKIKPWYHIVGAALVHPFNILLLLLGILAMAVEQDETTLIFLCCMVFLSVSLRSFQEIKSQKTFKSMRDLIEPHTRVMRLDYAGASREVEIAITDVVPGDILRLRAGDIFPGDVRILESKDLFVSQSSLTGEFLPVEKSATVNEVPSCSVFDLSNICFMSTSVVSGRGLAMVIGTAGQTYMSTISASLQSGSIHSRNAFDVGVKKVAYLLLGFGCVMVPIVIVINGMTTHDFYAAALFGMSVLVGLTPEMLPMILNANLAFGASEMTKHKTIVRKLDAVQTMGAVDVICSDKTGTLTQDNVVLTQHLDASMQVNDEVLKEAMLNSHFSTGLKNIMDMAVMKAAEARNFLEEAQDKYVMVDELPFDFVRRRMSVVLRTPSEKYRLICKGAVEELLDICSLVREYHGQSTEDVPLTPDYKTRLLENCSRLNEDGLRVLAVASCPISPIGVEDHDCVFDIQRDEQYLIFHGFLTFLDPPKEDCAEAVADFATYNVHIKVLTGDNLTVTRKICKDVGIPVDHCITGPELDGVPEEKFDDLVERCTVFAKLTPIQKFNVVTTLKRNGHTVGFLGDGINDALALRGSDCGISVDTATPLAKDAADIILLEKSLNVITKAIIRGRITHANTIKYIKMAASSNFGNVFSVLIASAWLPFQPMTGNQILTQNLLYDISQIAIPWDNVDEEFLRYPHQWSAKSIFKFMLFLGPLSSVFDIETYLIQYFFFKWQNPSEDSMDSAHFQTGWFYEGLLTQTLIVHMIRTQKIPFFQRNPSWQLALGTVTVMAVGLIIPYTPLGTNVLGMTRQPALYFPFLIQALVGYFCLTQLMKKFYMWLWKEWL
ncbi:hypothetical protein EC973_002241 [Apophysomyces ossiformis]|uniref:Magnesium-transporting ATPase, P-type 1 n=1 Tax=Apophysomyces ossiformis TaxID=679940 RepID=A0A8H7BYE6_9FUNG|nr:hypothetical protein EC973_002241 [Apophysomyces ossiformis]